MNIADAAADVALVVSTFTRKVVAVYRTCTSNCHIITINNC